MPCTIVLNNRPYGLREDDHHAANSFEMLNAWLASMVGEGKNSTEQVVANGQGSGSGNAIWALKIVAQRIAASSNPQWPFQVAGTLLVACVSM